MKSLIFNESSEKSLCDDCRNKKRCTDCNMDQTDFYSYKNGKLYTSRKECFNKNLRCEFCNKEINKSYLRSHIKKQHLQHNNQQLYNQQQIQQHYNLYFEKQHYNQQQNNDGASEGASEKNSGASEKK